MLGALNYQTHFTITPGIGLKFSIEHNPSTELVNCFPMMTVCIIIINVVNHLS